MKLKILNLQGNCYKEFIIKREDATLIFPNTHIICNLTPHYLNQRSILDMMLFTKIIT